MKGMGESRRLMGIALLAGLLCTGALWMVLKTADPAAPAPPVRSGTGGETSTQTGLAGPESVTRAARLRERVDPRGRRTQQSVLRDAQADAANDAATGLAELNELRKRLEEQQAQKARAAAVKRERVDPLQERFVETHHSDGSLFRTGRMQGGQRTGLWTERFESGARVETVYVDGKRHGLEAAWHPDGTSRFLGEYAGDKMVGVWTAWHPNGAILSTREYVDDKAHGWMRTFHESGSLAEESLFVDGLESGVNRGWHANGLQAWEMTYVDGLREGPATWWDDAANLFASGTYVSGALHGTYVEYAPDGTVKRTERWDQGRRVALTD
jgi:antitoxin component YwqK of YwqJK toxin-antitoxin module